MSELVKDSGVRKRLIDAGLKELLEHGPDDFSLRRVASMAQVSCATPYRHFKDKDELVRAVISQIRENWLLLSEQIKGIFKNGSAELVTELSVAAVRFWVAGDNFAPFLRLGELAEFDSPILEAIGDYCENSLLEDERCSKIEASILALIYGTVTLVLSKRCESDSAVKILRNQINRILL